MLWLWWCLLPADSMHSPLLTPARGALQCCYCSLYKSALFLLRKHMQLPTSATSETGDESVPLLCFDSRNCFCCVICCERKEESFPVVKKLGKDCYCMSCWNFSGFYLWRIKTLNPFPGFLEDSQGFNWINILVFLMYPLFLFLAFATCFTLVTMVHLVVSDLP